MVIFLHVWQVAPMELFLTVYQRHSYANRHRSYNALLILSLAWIAASWAIGHVLDKWIHRHAEEEGEDEE